MPFPNTTQRRFLGVRLAALLLAWAAWLLPDRLAAADAAQVEYKVKAGYLFNFVKFVEWPAAAFTNASAPYVIGLVGEDPFGPMLEEALAKQVVNGRNFVVRRLEAQADPGGCHVLFISRSERGRLREIFKTVGDRPILTVGETERFGQAGGMLNFTLVQGQVKLEANPTAAGAAGLQISSKLLSAAKTVKPDPSRERD